MQNKSLVRLLGAGLQSIMSPTTNHSSDDDLMQALELTTNTTFATSQPLSSESGVTTTTTTSISNMTQLIKRSAITDQQQLAVSTTHHQALLLVSQQDEQQQQQLQTSSDSGGDDWWQDSWSRQPFPSGYTQSSITLLACIMTTIIFLIVVGNLLVCIAIFTEKSLKPTQNWFIASLAVSDMLLGIVVMPFSLARELMGFWVFGPLWCDMHEALDVLLSTASINTLCLISLDRYWSITQAVNYLKKRTPRRGALMIAFVWVFSAAVSLPPLFGWKKQPSAQTVSIEPPQVVLVPNNSTPTTTTTFSKQQDVSFERKKRRPSEQLSSSSSTTSDPFRMDEFDYRAMSSLASSQRGQQQSTTTFNNYNQQLNTASAQPVQQQQQQQPQLASNEYPMCQLSEDVGYVMYSALGSFYIPCAVMVFTYIKIFLAARSRARRAINKQSRAGHNQTIEKGGKSRGGKSDNNNNNLLASNARARTIAGTTRATGAIRTPAEAAQPLTNTRGDSATPLLESCNAKIDCQMDNNNTQHAPIMAKGKLVLVERRKSTLATIAALEQHTTPSSNKQQQQHKTCDTNIERATILTSGAPQHASPSILRGDAAAQPDSSSSLITVMSSSMNELPVTRFNFKQHRQQASGEHDQAAALLKAISQAGGSSVEQNDISEMLRAEIQQQSDMETSAAAGECDGEQLRGSGGATNNATSETCFMTIEEDSDNLDAQTGRTIMMIASNAKANSSLTNKERAQSHVLTMLPATESASGTAMQCNNAACLRRARQRRRRATHATDLSVCGSSIEGGVCGGAVCDGDHDDDDDDEEEEEEDEEEDDDECLGSDDDDDSLTIDCNGYSNASCTDLDQLCAADSATCLQCHECAAFSRERLTQRDDLESQASGGCTKSREDLLLDSPAATSAAHHQHRSTGANVCANCHHHHHHYHHQKYNKTTNSEVEVHSFTCDDNLSLTDYRSNEDNSSTMGHDMLDATPARHKSSSGGGVAQKRRSIVAALASVGALGGGRGEHKQVTTQQGGGAGQQQLASKTKQEAEHKKSSSIGFRLGRLGSSAPSPLSKQTAGGLLALAAESQQQQEQQQQLAIALSIGNSTNSPLVSSPLPPLAVTNVQGARNLKTLRQNFFQKLNQLTAKSAAKQHKINRSRSPAGGKSSGQSSYGSSYEPSIDYATTSNVHSTNEQYHQETTFGETDEFDQRNTSGETKQSSDQVLSAVDSETTSRSPVNINNRKCSQPNDKLQSDEQQSDPNETAPSLLMRQSVKDASNDNNQSKVMTTTTTSTTTTNNTTNTKIHNAHQSNEILRKPDLTSQQLKRAPLAPGQDYANEGAKKRSTDRMSSTLCNRLDRSANNITTQSVTTHGTSGGGGGGGTRSTGTTNTSRAYLASDNERHKRKLAKARERRATLILGLIMAAFVCSWLPFFTFYVLRALCHVCRDYISPRFEAFIFWMGYCNSAINPIIYTIFNRDFRKAFRKILFKCL